MSKEGYMNFKPITWLTIAVTILILGFTVYVYYDLHQRKNKAMEVAEKILPAPEPKVVPLPVTKLKPKVRINSASYDGKILIAKVTQTKGLKVKYILNIGYCSYEGIPNKKGNIIIQPEWTPLEGRITFGVYNPDTGKYLESVKLERRKSMLTSKAARQIVSEGIKEGIRLRTFHALEKFEFEVTPEYKELVEASFKPFTTTELGKISAAVKKIGEKEYLVALSFCSPKDIFNRKVGHAIAIGRLRANKVVKFTVDEGGRIKLALKPIIHEYAYDHGIGWMRKASALV